MYAGDFAHKVRQLNRNIRFACGDNPRTPASMYIVRDGEEVTLCGVDKNELPEKTVFDKQGHIIKGGWRRAIKILIQTRLVDKRKAEKVFQTKFNLHEVVNFEPEADEIQRAMQEIENRKIDGAYRKADLVDVGRMISCKRAK